MYVYTASVCNLPRVSSLMNLRLGEGAQSFGRNSHAHSTGGHVRVTDDLALVPKRDEGCIANEDWSSNEYRMRKPHAIEAHFFCRLSSLLLSSSGSWDVSAQREPLSVFQRVLSLWP